MRIVHFTESLNDGGIASFLIGLTQAQSRFEKISICTIFRNNHSIDFLENGQVEVNSLCKPSSLLSYVYFPFLIASKIAKSDDDIVHIHCSFVYYILAVIFLHRRKRFFYTVHSDAFREKDSSRIESMIWPLKRFCFKKGWVNPITISKQSEASFFKLYHFHAKVIVNGIQFKEVKEALDITHYRLTPSTKVFVHAGRISEAKNQLTMCQAFSRCIADGADAILLIAGSIQDKQIYSQLLPLFNDRIIYVGQRNDMLSVFKAADFMLLPSIWEGMPISLLESMSQRCIPICSPVGGIPEVITSMVSGILTKDSSEQSVYESLVLALKLTKAELSRMANNSFDAVQRYSIDRTAIDYLTYYKNL